MGPPLRLLWGGPIDTGSAIATRRADTWVRPYVYYGAGLQTHRDPAGGHVGPPLRQLWGGPIDTSRPGGGRDPLNNGRTRGSAPRVEGRDVGDIMGLLWGGPIDTSRPGGRTRGSAPTSTIATRRADTWVRPYVYYGAGLQTHRDPAGGHVGPPLRLLWGGPRHIATRRADTWVRPYVWCGPTDTSTSRPGGRTRGSAPTPIMLMIAEQLPARAALDPERGHRYSGPQIHRTQGGGEIL